MPPTFRYRYVDIGTVFTGDSRRRAPEADTDSPSILFANELACDVGGTCWGANEPLPILDHHFAHSTQFPSACAAVLHKSGLIRSRFAELDGIIWLVTHNEPDFDAFGSMYLARRIIENDMPEAGWKSYGLHLEGWLDSPTAGKIDWSNPDLGKIPSEHRWQILLAGYASLLETREQIPCPIQRQLRSVLYAALKRGREYLNVTSGATEFFDQVRSILKENQLNPVLDSVLEGSASFAPELAMLDREVGAYNRDLQRSRKALVYLPEAEAPSPDFFEHAKRGTQQPSPDMSAENLLLADSFRIATDGIYLRDPECTLFQEWARVDRNSSSLRAGFEFSAIAYPDRIPEGGANSTEYIFSIDPERANGRHLFTVWSRLQTEELKALRLLQESPAPKVKSARTADAHRKTVESLLSNPWSGGDRRSGTLVETPQHGTRIGSPGSRCDLRDDPVVEAVRTELEGPIYAAASLVSGPQVTVHDIAASRALQDAGPRQLDFNAPLTLSPPEAGYFRFASIGLRPDVPIGTGDEGGDVLARQIGENLWQFLYPEEPGDLPPDFERRLVVRGDAISVWGKRGVAIARKQGTAAKPASTPATAGDDLQDFASLVSLVRDIDRLASEWESIASGKQARTGAPRRTTAVSGSAQPLLADGEEAARRALELQRTLALPDRELLRHFSGAVGFEQLVARLRDLNQVASENLHREGMAAKESSMQEKAPGDVARLRQQLRWLEVFVVGFIALEIVAVVTHSGILATSSQQLLALFGAPLAFACAVWLLQPWRLKPAGPKNGGTTFKWIIIAAVVVWILAWLSQVIR